MDCEHSEQDRREETNICAAASDPHRDGSGVELHPSLLFLTVTAFTAVALILHVLLAIFGNDSHQMQRAAVSVPANIAEGHGRKSTNAFLNHLSIANGSLMELETHLQISLRLGYLAEQQASDILLKTGEIGRMINGLRNALAAQTKEVTSES